MRDWPKKTHWRKCIDCDLPHRVIYSRKKKRFTLWACPPCRWNFVKRGWRAGLLERMGPSARILHYSDSSVRQKEWFMKRELKEFIPLMVNTLGAELAKEVYVEAFDLYQEYLIRQWEHSLLSDILSQQQ